MGVGPAGLHSSLRVGDNYFDADQLRGLEDLGVAGQLNQRFIDLDGRPVATPLDDLVVGVTLEQLASARRRVVVAGGSTKHAAITAALRGGWVDSLITDVATARFLAQQVDEQPLPAGTNRR